VTARKRSTTLDTHARRLVKTDPGNGGLSRFSTLGRFGRLGVLRASSLQIAQYFAHSDPPSELLALRTAAGSQSVTSLLPVIHLAPAAKRGEADAGGEWKVRADAHEHPPPVPVIDVKVVLNDPALGHLKMPSVRGLIADSSHDTRGFTRLEDDRHGAGLSSSEVRIDEFITTALRRLYDREYCASRPVRSPSAGTG
jgi:hypothetical protein